MHDMARTIAIADQRPQRRALSIPCIAPDYCIDPFFRDLLPPLSRDERRELKAQISKAGQCLTPLIVWREKGILLDGHHRDELAGELRAEGKSIAPTKVVLKSFSSRLAAVRWMIDFQNARRNWSPADRAAVVLRNREMIERLRIQAKARMLAGGREPTEPDDLDPPAHAPKGGVRRYLARLAGVGEGTIAAVDKILKSGDTELIDKLLARNKLSVREAVRLLRRQQADAVHQQRARAAREQWGLPPRTELTRDLIDQVVVADVLEALARIAKESVSLVFTSPPYALPSVFYENFHYDGNYGAYLQWLGSVFAAIVPVLRLGGRLAVNVDSISPTAGERSAGREIAWQPFKPVYADIVRLGVEAGLEPMTEICWLKQKTVGRYRNDNRSFCSCRSPRIWRNHEYILVFAKGSAVLEGDPSLCDLTPDEYRHWAVSTWEIPPVRRTGSDAHPAPFPEALAERVIRLFSYVGDVVLDPFCGTGTVPFVAKKFGRRFIGIDNAATYVAAARARVASLG
jgi:DNA modification methylase